MLKFNEQVEQVICSKNELNILYDKRLRAAHRVHWRGSSRPKKVGKATLSIRKERSAEMIK